MLAIRKMGPIGNLLGMLPGAGQMKDALAAVDDSQLDRLQAIIRGMTPHERADPKIINASRRLRIANGSGVTVSEVNQLVDRFFEARKMMSSMVGSMGVPGYGRRPKEAQKARRARRAQEQWADAAARSRGCRRGLPAGFPAIRRNMPQGRTSCRPGWPFRPVQAEVPEATTSAAPRVDGTGCPTENPSNCGSPTAGSAANR